MKRILSLVITGVICASLVACSSTGESTTQYFDTSNEVRNIFSKYFRR